MAVASVTFDGTRVSAAESATDGGTWDKWGAAQAPSVEPDIVWQFGGSNSDLSNKVGSGTAGGVEMDQSTGTHDFTTGHASGVEQVWLPKYWITNYSALNVKGTTGSIVYLGTSNAAYYHYHSHGNDTYPPAGGWIFEAINPNISGYRDGTTGSPAALTGVDYWGLSAQFTAVSKSENVVMSAIDFFPEGKGLTLVGGDGASADGLFSDFVAFDQGTNSNRYGIVRDIEGNLLVLGTLTIGSATETDFTDSNAKLSFLDSKCNAGFAGLAFGMSNASSVIAITDASFTGRGTKAGTTDTRPDYTATGTSGTLDFTGSTFDNFRNWLLTSVTTLTNCIFLGGELVTVGAGSIVGGRFSGGTGTHYVLASNPALVDECDFTQGVSGHAVRCDTIGTYDWSNTDTGYTGTRGSNPTASTGSTDAMFYNNSGGLITLNVASGADSPSVRNGAGATTVVVAGTVVTAITVRDHLNVLLQNARVRIEASDGTGDLPYRETVTITRVSSTAAVAHTAHGLNAGDKVVIRYAAQPEYNGVFTISNVTTNAYDYTVGGTPATPATIATGQAAIISSGCVLEGLTNASGFISATRAFSVAQPVIGTIKKSTSVPFFKPDDFSDTISTTLGLTKSSKLVLDE